MIQKSPICLSCDHYLQKDSDPSGESEFCGKPDSGPPQAIRPKPTACTDHQDPKCRPIRTVWEQSESVAKHCRANREQWCHICANMDCGDNTSPIKLLRDKERGIGRTDIEVGLLPTELPFGPKFKVFEVTVPDMGRMQRVCFKASVRMAGEPCNPGEARLTLSFDPEKFVK